MKALFLYLVVAGILLQHVCQTVIFTDFCLHKNYIAKVLCENRNNPSMHCNGKCHLHKQFQQDEKRKGSDRQSLPEMKELSWDNPPAACFNFNCIPGKNHFADYFVNGDYETFLPTHFHPPCA